MLHSPRSGPLALGWQYPSMIRGVRVGASTELVEVCSTVCGLFLVWLAGEGGGGVWSWPWSRCCYAVGRALGTKRLIVIDLLVTMSWPWSDSVFEELIDSTVASSVTRIGASGSTRASSSTKTSGWTGTSGWILSCAVKIHVQPTHPVRVQVHPSKRTTDQGPELHLL